MGAAFAAGWMGLRWEAPAASVAALPPVPVSADLVLPEERPTPTFEVQPEPVPPLTPVEASLPFEVEHPVDDRDLVAVEPLVPAPEKPAPAIERPLRSSLAISLAPPPAAPTPEVEAEQAPVEILNPPPPYPSLARRKGLEGHALVEVRVLADGSCADPRLLECAGSPLFGEVSLETVRGWRYRPATLGGKPVESTQRVRFVFKLRS
jgi:protein TonB